MKVVECYGVTKNTDRTEGRGNNVSTGIYFADEKDAIKYVESFDYAEKFGIQGTAGDEYNVERCTLKIFRNFDDYVSYTVNVRDTARRAELLANMSAGDRALFEED